MRSTFQTMGCLRNGGKSICLVLLLSVVAFSLINTLVWLRIDTRPPRWDESHHLTMSLQYYDALTSGGVAAFAKSLLTVDPVRPPLVPALAVPAYFLSGRSTDAAFAVNLLAFIGLILAVYGSGEYVASPWVGLLAAFLVATYPALVGMSRLFLLDFCNAALVAVALYLLLRTEQFSQRGPSLAFGAVVGCGLLCRQFFPMFIIGPGVISAYRAWKNSQNPTSEKGLRRDRWWKNVGLAFVLGAAVAAPWYLVNLGPVLWRSFDSAYGVEASAYGPANPVTLHMLTNFFIVFTNVVTTLLGLLLFLVGGIVVWISRPAPFAGDLSGRVDTRAHCLFLVSAVVIPVLICATARNQDLKHVVPILPAMAAISAWGLSLLTPAVVRKVVIGVAVGCSLSQVWLCTYEVQTLPQAVGLRVKADLPPLFLYQQAAANPNVGFPLLPRRENWHISEILMRITEEVANLEGAPSMVRPVVVAIVPDHALFNANNFGYFAMLDKVSVRIERPGDPRTAEGKDYQPRLLGADFAVIKTGDPGPRWVNLYSAGMIEFLRSPASGFKELTPSFPLPDGSQAVVYIARGRSGSQ
jgi:4-amino-4-deoxy-L-arabinose transferase-like glycosyltransferase